MSAGLDRAWTEAFYAEQGLTLLDPEWTAIEQAVSTAPPVPDDVAEQIAARWNYVRLVTGPRRRGILVVERKRLAGSIHSDVE
ncbi:hypothetical protein AB0N89_32050 [Amycolatopsis sp. NPDC089917]|uniref:hypothetical protein n=1 Tax=Amycolatopsis sp. NPDC089917 TaxID=3155187 RepID=UPI0034258E1C